MQRIQGVDQDKVSGGEAEILEASNMFLGRSSNLLKILTNTSPKIARWFLGFLTATRQEGLGASSDVGLRGLACVKTSMTNECNYCTSHTSIYAQGLGYSEAQISLMTNDSYKDSDQFSDKEKLSIEWAEAITLNKAAYDGPLWDRMRREFSDAEIVEITLASSMFNMINRLNDTFRSELETTDYNKKQWDATGELPIDAQEAFAGSFPKQVFSK
ncbi:MAG: carboxymuconolactone decarboxylase family protein [Alphaproteobacteria bacterium]|jgi:alkylhydroperoxidase family enzyme|nr:carboxymuconolactone decarboxylase family protein [Alphaproteobacteria bacterium]MBT5798632.1 carboxymuconolactone decarboxylase family protein [Alphaproteobacteria bacterium]MDC3311787.1 hypothetical protein [Alphaproteobacteria bacterium]